ncbi:MAG: maltokinase [Actinomycetota bacterium]|jgi:maltokinase|nr:maltokinase [Actinomycetota bacterium]MDQ1504643.1 maltokinase [Actinomycetota bacterium]
MISPTALAPQLAEYLPRQRWFGAKDRTIELVRIRSLEVLCGERSWPALLRVDAEVHFDGTGDARYQVLLGMRPTGVACEFLTGHEPAVLGEFETGQGQALVYDALLDSELALALLGVVAPEYSAERVRPLGAEQSNTSLVYDDAMILKVFRRLTEGHNPEVEVIETLAACGFTSVPEPLASWRKDDVDLAFLQRYLAGATDGWNIALASLRELFAEHAIGAALPPADALGLAVAPPSERVDPAEARGDFAAEAERIGEVTAELHQAMARGFGSTRVTGADWAEPMEEQLERVLGAAHSSEERALAEGARRIITRLREIPDPGPAIRVHGDYHLGQVLRTDAGWFVLDFEGEPARPLEERTRPSSPLKDVAGMLRSLSYAPAVALSYQEDDMTTLGRAWETRNRECFLAGYLRKAQFDAETGQEPILPTDPAVRSAVLAAFELDKALYEVAYERANRPDWARIPMEAVGRLTGAAARTI